MKRSEVVNALVKFVYEASGGESALVEEEASLVLRWLEDIGMRPPGIIVNSDTWYRDTGDYGREVNEWESED